jgi:hypothetical protein
MAEIEEVKLDEHWYFCTACEELIQGELKPIMAKYTENMAYLDPDYFFLSVEEWDQHPLVSVLKCTDCENTVKYPVDEEVDTPIARLAPGDSVWKCTNCDTWYPDPTTASECCA